TLAARPRNAPPPGLAAAAGPAAAPTGAAAERRLRRRTVDGEGGNLLQHVRRLARRAGDDLVLAADELVEMVLAFHARVLVDRHGSSVLCSPMERWMTPTLEGDIVRLEPLALRHGDDLYEASRD